MKAKLLRVNLDNGEIGVQELDDTTLRRYIGGSGLAAKILWEETSPTTEPLSPENRLVFAIGPLTGITPMSTRHVVAAISPATGGWGQATAGGVWARELHRAGWTGIVFQGRAKAPVYLYVNNDHAELRDATALWGRDTYETSDLILKQIDPKASVACIGQAGENLVFLAGVMNDGWVGRIAARGGLGAVMGSKNLKAVAVRGTLTPPVADEKGLAESTRPAIKALVEVRKEMGTEAELLTITARMAPHIQEMGGLRVKNFTGVRFPSYVQNMQSFAHERRYYCYRCPVGCSESTMGAEGRGPVGEALGPLGPNCLIDDIKALEKANVLCNRYGLDTISVGACIAFGMEAFEKGLITLKETGGVDLTWGNAGAMLEMVREIAEARGFGRVLGQGVKRAARHIGGDSTEFAMEVKGLEPPVHDPRIRTSLMIAYATNNRGACHVESLSYPMDRKSDKRGSFQLRSVAQELGLTPEPLSFKGRPEMVQKTQDAMDMLNSLVVCGFSSFYYGSPLHSHLDWLNYVTGWDMSFGEFLKNGERIFNLKRLFNLRRGFSAKDDTIPRRFLSHRPGAEALEAIPESFKDLIQEYYALRGWTRMGVPTRKKLAELELPPA